MSLHVALCSLKMNLRHIMIVCDISITKSMLSYCECLIKGYRDLYEFYQNNTHDLYFTCTIVDIEISLTQPFGLCKALSQ